MRVPFLNLKAHHAPLIDEFDRAIREVIESSAFAGGGPSWKSSKRNSQAIAAPLMPLVSLMAQTRFGSLSSRHVYHVYSIRVQKRDEVRRRLEEKEIGCAVHYPIPIHLQEACRSLGYTAGAFPIAENLAEEFLSLPMFPELTEHQIEYVARCVSETVGVGLLV